METLELELEKPRLARNFCSSLGFVVDLMIVSFSFFCFLFHFLSGLKVDVAVTVWLTIGLISLLILTTFSILNGEIMAALLLQRTFNVIP